MRRPWALTLLLLFVGALSTIGLVVASAKTIQAQTSEETADMFLRSVTHFINLVIIIGVWRMEMWAVLRMTGSLCWSLGDKALHLLHGTALSFLDSDRRV